MNCANCNTPFVADEHTTGYAICANDVKVCYACADTIARADMVGASRFTGYLSGDGARFTTWTGGTLGDVVSSKPCKLTRTSFTHDKRTYRSVRVRDVWGKIWFGRGSAGIVQIGRA